ncbi:MAG: DUF2100 domain-containing protein [Candidatus Thorarchaeota archaeon]
MRKLDSKDVKSLLAAIDDLLEIKILIREVVPNYELDEQLLEKYLFILGSLQSKLVPLFLKYLVQNSTTTKKKSKQELINKIKEFVGNLNIILVSSNSNKKKLKELGIDPRNIIVSGGPILIKNYLKINPNISNKILPSIKKKSENLILKLKNLSSEDTDIVFLYDHENKTDKIILEELLEISGLIGKKITSYDISV